MTNANKTIIQCFAFGRRISSFTQLQQEMVQDHSNVSQSSIAVNGMISLAFIARSSISLLVVIRVIGHSTIFDIFLAM